MRPPCGVVGESVATLWRPVGPISPLGTGLTAPYAGPGSYGLGHGVSARLALIAHRAPFDRAPLLTELCGSVG